ncbi:MAG TPA: hypothetical protein VHY20_13985, partial [Pirellulales bacterium]|nr:hypothetical protein [Pirellulales bacterium]
AWGVLARGAQPEDEWSIWNCPLHPSLVGISGFVVLLVVGGALAAAAKAGVLRANPRQRK